MPKRKVLGLPRAKKGDKFLLIKGSGRSKYAVQKLKKRK